MVVYAHDEPTLYVRSLNQYWLPFAYTSVIIIPALGR